MLNNRPVLLRFNVPALIFTSPWKVLLPDNVNVPEPDLVKSAEPVMIPP